jgi:putative hemolysin
MDDRAFTYCDPADPLWKRLAIGALEKATGRDEIKRLYVAHQQSGWGAGGFFETAIGALSLDVRYDASRLDAIPKTGPLVIVANHPFGVIDGIVMCALMQKARPDFVALTNSVLRRAPEMAERMLPVDFTDSAQARRTNVATRAAALRHLHEGGAVVIFPAGAVSTSPDLFGRKPAIDGPWSPFAARLVLQAKAPVVPIFFPGQNSTLFQFVSHVHVNLRLALFFHEVRRRIDSAFPVEIGTAIPFENLAGLDRPSLTAEMRRATYALAGQPLPR